MATHDVPLRIALLTYRGKPHVGGQGVYTRHLTKALVDLGHHVEVFSGQPYPELDERVPLHELPSLDIYNDHFPMRMPGLWELKTLADFVEVTAFSHRHVPRAAGLLGAGLPGTCATGATTSTWSTTTSASATACSAFERLGFPLLATIHHPITVDRRLEMEHADDAATSGSRCAAGTRFTRMQTAVAQPAASGSSPCRRTPSRTSTATTRCPATACTSCRSASTRTCSARSTRSTRRPGRLITTASADVTMKGLAVPARGAGQAAHRARRPAPHRHRAQEGGRQVGRDHRPARPRPTPSSSSPA